MRSLGCVSYVDRFLSNYIASKAIMQTPFTEIARLNCA